MKRVLTPGRDRFFSTPGYISEPKKRIDICFSIDLFQKSDGNSIQGHIEGRCANVILKWMLSLY